MLQHLGRNPNVNLKEQRLVAASHSKEESATNIQDIQSLTNDIND